MPTQVQIRGAIQVTQEARTLVSRELDVNTTDTRLSVHNGSTAGGIPHANFLDVVNQTFNYANATGTNALTMSLERDAGAYLAGQKVAFKAASNNTGSATLNVNGNGAVTLKKISGASIVDLEADDIIADAIYEVTYDGTNFILGAGGSGASIFDSQNITSSVSAVEITGFAADKNYIVKIEGLEVTSDGATLNIRTSSDGGSTFDSSAGNYAWFHLTAQNNSDTRIALLDPAVNGVGSAAGESYAATLFINNPRNSSNDSTISGIGGYEDSAGAPRLVSFYSKRRAQVSIDAIQIFASLGNIDSGQITVYEEDI